MTECVHVRACPCECACTCVCCVPVSMCVHVSVCMRVFIQKHSLSQTEGVSAGTHSVAESQKQDAERGKPDTRCSTPTGSVRNRESRGKVMGGPGAGVQSGVTSRSDQGSVQVTGMFWNEAG